MQPFRSRARFLLAAASLLGAVLVPASLLNGLIPPWLQPNWLVVCTVYGTVAFPWRRVVPWIAVGGLLADLYAPQAFGVTAWSALACGLAVHTSARRLLTDFTLPARLTLGAVGSLTYRAAFVAAGWANQAAFPTPWRLPHGWSTAALATHLAQVVLEVAVFTALSLVGRRRPWPPDLRALANPDL